MTSQASVLSTQTSARAQIREMLAQTEERMGRLLAEERARWSAVGIESAAFGDGLVSGKPARLDFAQHKMTLLAALAIEADPDVVGLLLAEPDDRELGALSEVLVRLGIREEVERRIASLVGEARAAIAAAPIGECWKAELDDLAYQVAYRDK